MEEVFIVLMENASVESRRQSSNPMSCSLNLILEDFTVPRFEAFSFEVSVALRVL